MKLILSHRMDAAKNTKAIWLEPEKPVQFIAGQFGYFTLVEPPFTDARGNTRPVSSAPPSPPPAAGSEACAPTGLARG